MGLFALAAAYRYCNPPKPPYLGEAPVIKPIIKNIYKKRYKELVQKKHWGGGLSIEELLELNRIQRPPWAEPGELWTY
jgi:hypothetical protein